MPANTAAATASLRAREDWYIKIRNQTYVKLLLPKSTMDDGLATAAGYQKEITEGDLVIGTDKAAALQFGCVAFNIYYTNAQGRTSTAKVVVSPAKADTFFSEARTKTYKSKNITNVRVPRRIKYVF
jgi:hypothetical protein